MLKNISSKPPGISVQQHLDACFEVLVRAGLLSDGNAVPGVQAVARQIGIRNVRPVERAYNTYNEIGFLKSNARVGTIVADHTALARHLLRRRLMPTIAQACSAGLRRGGAEAVVRDCIGVLYGENVPDLSASAAVEVPDVPPDDVGACIARIGTAVEGRVARTVYLGRALQRGRSRFDWLLDACFADLELLRRVYRLSCEQIRSILKGFGVNVSRETIRRWFVAPDEREAIQQRRNERRRERREGAGFIRA